MLAEPGLYNSLRAQQLSQLSQQLANRCVSMGIQHTPFGYIPFRQRVLTPQQQAYYGSMSAVRSSVEWLFSDVVNYYKFLHFKKNLKTGLSQVGKMYIVCAILQNVLTCLYGNSTSQFFVLDPPSLEDHFS